MPSTILHLFLPDRPRDGEGRSPARQLAHLLGPEASGLLTLLEESDTALTFCAQAEAAPARAALRTLMEAHLPQLTPELYMIQAYPAPEEPAVHRNDAAESTAERGQSARRAEIGGHRCPPAQPERQRPGR